MVQRLLIAIIIVHTVCVYSVLLCLCACLHHYMYVYTMYAQSVGSMHIP